MSVDVIPILQTSDYAAHIERGAEALRRGEVLILPTETVYGAAAILTQPAAVEKLRAFRGGEPKPLTIHLASPNDAYRFIGETSELGRRMIRKLWPGPVAIMFDVPEEFRREVAATQGISEEDVYEGNTITLRCPHHTVTEAILSRVDAPIAFTKAGSGDRPPEPGEVEGLASLIFDAGPSRFSKPSTIIKLL
ncbi:MAG: Sua5/YciO/YrdC/YwlC family protein, partial [Phycisphaerae bacterium]|nr:Sua5/YciO/YrdC/YwlC family protein [Phycisphaerae bacterium]